MTVKQLIDELSKYPEETIVVDIECIPIEEVRPDTAWLSEKEPRALVVRLI